VEKTSFAKFNKKGIYPNVVYPSKKAKTKTLYGGIIHVRFRVEKIPLSLQNKLPCIVKA